MDSATHSENECSPHNPLLLLKLHQLTKRGVDQWLNSLEPTERKQFLDEYSAAVIFNSQHRVLVLRTPLDQVIIWRPCLVRFCESGRTESRFASLESTWDYRVGLIQHDPKQHRCIMCDKPTACDEFVAHDGWCANCAVFVNLIE
jgi:hypothetical protein